MEKRVLGRSSITVAPLMFGGNVFGWTADEPTSFALLDAFVDAGFDFIDTADVYSRWVPGHTGYESETIIGNWLARGGKRDRVIIATKLGMVAPDGERKLSRNHIITTVEGSLRRMQTDYIDLYQAHQDSEETPLEETLEAFDDLVKAGKVRVIGASNYKAARLKAALDTSAAKNIVRFESHQPEYNLFDRSGFESELEPLCLSEKVGVISYFSLASGFLSGKYRSEADLKDSARGEMVKKYLNERGLRILAALDRVAETVNATQTQVAIAWLIARPSITAPIVSATTLKQLDDLIAAAHLKLDDASIALLNDASAETVAA